MVERVRVMANPTSEQLAAAVAHHRSLPEDKRVFDDPPVVHVQYRCGDCDKAMEPAVLGWTLIMAVVDEDLAIPAKEVVSLCDSCEASRARE